MLPFELVLAGNGFPGFGQPLLLQNQTPLCLTREVRRVKDVELAWAAHARILFVCASPSGLPKVPVEAHLLALRRAVDPWVAYFDEDDEDERRRQVDRCLHVLPAASIGAIQDACAQGDYTHVHVLAHGVTRHDGFDLRFGIALHDEADPDGPPDVVGGDRFASALRPLARPDREGFARPMVVTLASCNSANGGSVVGAGASVAHALQEAGVPLVVAGQFPLTFEGSVELVETLYDGLLWGADPRTLLMELRRRMHVLQPRSHDWASLTAYAALPVDFDDQLCGLAIGRARTALEVAMDHADRVLVTATRAQGKTPTEPMMKRARDRIDRPWSMMAQLVDRVPKRRFELLGLLASLCKRRAEIELAASMMFQMTDTGTDAQRNECRALLEQSRDDYFACFRERRDTAWAIVQFLSLALLLELPSTGGDDPLSGLTPERHTRLQRMWSLAWAISMDEVDDDDVDRAGWALGNLIELPLLARLLRLPAEAGALSWDDESKRWVDELVRRADTFAFQIYSTRRQIERYAFWFSYVNGRFDELRTDAEALTQRFPTEDRDA